MITRADIVERANEWGLSESVVEKDYVIGWLLWGIGAHPLLSRSWAFKGGTCLKKCFFETYRFSEDLDFSVLPGSPFQDAAQVFDEAVVRRAIDEVLEAVQEASGLNVFARDLYLKPRNHGRGLEGRVYYLGPTGSTQVAKIKLDISGTEAVVRPTVMAKICHSFPDVLPGPASVRAYSFEEVFAEKIRAMGERGRPRDLYDIVNLYRHQGLGRAPELIREVLIEKCVSKGVEVPTEETVLGASTLPELWSEWENMLGHQLPDLPPVEAYVEELRSLFRWLQGELDLEELPAFNTGMGEQAAWTPPPIISLWGVAGIESLRFAAANLLLVKIGYKGGFRLVEPYSLRRTMADDLLLYAQRPEQNQIKSYRVDRIHGIEVQREVFEPRYPVDFTPGGSITARPTRRGPGSRGGLLGRTRSPDRPYAVRCPRCEKIFRRKRPSTRLNAHKDPSGFLCSARTGIRIE